jgi:hypothetical protein
MNKPLTSVFALMAVTSTFSAATSFFNSGDDALFEQLEGASNLVEFSADWGKLALDPSPGCPKPLNSAEAPTAAAAKPKAPNADVS